MGLRFKLLGGWEAWKAKQVYWLSDAEWRRIEPFLPRGAHRVDDRRVINGIVHVVRWGARCDCPEIYRPYTTTHNRWSRQGIWTEIVYALAESSWIYGSASVDSTYIQAHRSAARCEMGPTQRHQSLARRTTDKICALTDDIDRRHVLLIAAGNVHYSRHRPKRVLADRVYDCRQLRQELAQRRIKAVIPPNPARKHPHRHNKSACKGRNVIERMFCRLKDFRRIATRYDKRADVYLSTISLAAVLTWWIN